MGQMRLNSSKPPNPNKPVREDVGTRTFVNRVDMTSWAVRITIRTIYVVDEETGEETGEIEEILILHMSAQAKGQAYETDPNELEDVESGPINYEVSLPLSEMEASFQTHINQIGIDMEAFLINDAFPGDVID